MESLVKHFVMARQAQGELLEDASAKRVGEALRRVLHSGVEAWPTLELDPTRFAEFLGREVSLESLVAIDAERAADIYLAHGCGEGNAAALRDFDEQYIGRIPRMLSHMKLSSSMLDEVSQQVRMKLLVDKGSGAKISVYAARGKLDGLVQVVATRAAISMTRKEKPRAHEDALLKVPDPAYDPGLHFMKESYREAFGECFELATKQLSSRDRNLMRLHLLDQVTLEQLATMYGVHRATIVRWLAKVREDLMMTTRELLAARLKVATHEFESLMQLIQSKLDLSVRRMLQTLGDTTPPRPD